MGARQRRDVKSANFMQIVPQKDAPPYEKRMWMTDLAPARHGCILGLAEIS